MRRAAAFRERQDWRLGSTAAAPTSSRPFENAGSRIEAKQQQESLALTTVECDYKQPQQRALARKEIVAQSRGFPHVKGLCVEVILEGEGASPVNGDRLQIHYACLITRTGGCVDSSRSKSFADRKPFDILIGGGQVLH